MKALLYVASACVGAIFGFLFLGAFVEHRLLLNGLPASNFTEDQVVEGLINNNAELSDSTHIIFFGVEIISADGAWLMNTVFLAFIFIPLIACHIYLVKRADKSF